MSYKRISPIPVVEGGTGAQAFTAHGVILGEGISALVATSVGTTNTVLLGNTGADPSFGVVPNAALANSSITLTSGTGITVTGSPVSLGGTATINLSVPVSIANGGTNATTMATTDGTVYYNGTSLVTTATGTSGQVLTSGGVGVAPAYATPAASSITITGNTGGPLTGNSFTFSGGTTGLSFGGSGTTETLTFAGITANAGVVNLGTDSVDNAINIGTAANTGRTITIGNTTGTSGIIERVGTGNYSLDGVAASTYTIGASTTTGTITIGGTAQSGALILGNSSATNIVEIGIGSATQTVNINTGGTNSKTTNIGTGAAANIITIGSFTGASNISIKTGSAGFTVNGTGPYSVAASVTTSTITIGGTAQTGLMTFGNSTAASTVSIAGGTGAGILQLAIAQTGGSIAMGTAMTTGTIQIGGTGAQTGSITLGTGTGAQTISLGTGAAAKATTLGSTTTGSVTTIAAPANGVFMSGVFGTTVGISGIPVLIDNTGNVGTVASSRRFKENIIDMGNYSSDIYNLRPVIFNYKNHSYHDKSVGLIAEEVADTMQNLVVKDAEGRPTTVKYLDLIPMLLNEIQILKKEVQELKEK